MEEDGPSGVGGDGGEFDGAEEGDGGVVTDGGGAEEGVGVFEVGAGA